MDTVLLTYIKISPPPPHTRILKKPILSLPGAKALEISSLVKNLWYINVVRHPKGFRTILWFMGIYQPLGTYYKLCTTKNEC